MVEEEEERPWRGSSSSPVRNDNGRRKGPANEGIAEGRGIPSDPFPLTPEKAAAVSAIHPSNNPPPLPALRPLIVITTLGRLCSHGRTSPTTILTKLEINPETSGDNPMEAYSIHYHFSQRFDFDAEEVYEWCVSFDAGDVVRMGKRGSRRIKRIDDDTLILTDTGPPSGRTWKRDDKAKTRPTLP